MNRTRSTAILIISAVLALAAGSVSAQETDRQLGVNVLVTIKVDDAGTDGSPRKREYRVLVREGKPTELLVGARMPLAVSVSTDGDGGEVRNFVYQNVGVAATLEVRTHSQDRIAVQGTVEVSDTIDPVPGFETPDGAPLIGTYQQQFSVLLRDGKIRKVIETIGPKGSLVVQMKAEVQG